MNQGLFIGLITLDLIYFTAQFPEQNQKIVALDDTVAAGGPATNAAVTFSHLGNLATLVGTLGTHPISTLIRGDLQGYGVKLMDLDPDRLQSPPVSSIIVTQGTSDRAVVSINATKFQAKVNGQILNLLDSVAVVLIDGHQIEVSQTVAKQAKQKNIPVVIDGGSWKSGFEEILPWVDYAICSANFYPPGCSTAPDVFSYLREFNIADIAITNGRDLIQYLSQEEFGSLSVPQVTAVDTLGAGDIFHGAFCYYILTYPFQESLSRAANIASHSCKFFGSRRWMEEEI